MNTFLEKLNQIRCFIFDVDGVLTDGLVLALESGEQARSFLVKDGFGIERALIAGYHVAVISGGKQEGVRKRLEFLKIPTIYLGVSNKIETFNQFLKLQNLNVSQILYMGDDWPDYDVMKLSGLPCCPSDATPEIKEISLYVSPFEGGKGCVRDVIEQVLRVQKKW